ncbi:hypothetical protein [Streptomyces sp. NBC_01429]|uniref:hypothetical protein n=1 Tax=Streptomyces sp. NBC_01429 TaxID=2903862 RepID=UPI002E28B840|nr:hypothetical protein [Streptomyces sp. NBC_01429]
MRKSLLAVIAVGGLAIGGTGLAKAGEGTAPESVSGASVLSDANGGSGQAAAPQVTNAAQAADLVLRQSGGGRVTGVGLAEEGGRAVWKVVFVLGSDQRGATVDALTKAVQNTAADPAVAGAGSGTFDDDSSCDDDDDDDFDDDDDDDDDDDGDRQGVEGSK